MRPSAIRAETIKVTGTDIDRPSEESRRLSSKLRKATSIVPRPFIPASAPVIRRGTSEDARVYRATSERMKPICAGVTAMATSTTATGQRRRSTRTVPTRMPNSAPAPVMIPVFCAKVAPSKAHSNADIAASVTSRTKPRRLPPPPSGPGLSTGPVVRYVRPRRTHDLQPRRSG